MSSTTTSANYWQTETIKAIRNMFDEQVDEETVSALFEQNENDIERTVDAIFVYLNKLEEAKREQEKRSKTIEELLEFEEIPEEIEISQSDINCSQAESINVKESNYTEPLASSTTSNNSVLIYEEEKPEFTLSEMETQTEYTVTTPEEKTVQTEEFQLSPDIRRFQERIEELSLNLSESKLAKVRVEEEKKNAMKWCVTEMEGLRYTVSEKDKIIVQQQEEIEQLKKLLTSGKSEVKEDNKLDKFIVESKHMIVEGVQSLSQQLSENINKIQKEFKDFKKADDKEWLVVEKLKEFAADFRREIAELFKDPITSPFKKSPKKVVTATTTTTTSPSREQQLEQQLNQERQLWQSEKASLETYIKELERQIKAYKELETSRADLSWEEIKDVQLIASQANVSEQRARVAYFTHNRDVVNAILSLVN